MRKQLGLWAQAGPDAVFTKITARQVAPQHVSVLATGSTLSGQVKIKLHYDIYGNADVRVSMHVDPKDSLPELPRVGMQLALPGHFNTLTWLGLGPHENYSDRKTGALVGLYSGQVAELLHPYARPQENGNRTDVRWAAFTDSSGRGLLAVAGTSLLNASAWPYTMADLEQASHLHKLPSRDTLTVNLDLAQRGLGSINSWGAQPLSKYTLPAQTYQYDFLLRPLTGSDQDPASLARRPAP
jgi:beta-galactosidase